MPITPLPHATVALLRSSQVITGSVSVIKELIDNSLDAQATSINVVVSANLLDLIRVTDNGCGIAREDQEVIGKRHYTSKIRGFDDLRVIGGTSFGFRGEALASTVELTGNGVTITTCSAAENVGTNIQVDSRGNIVSQEKIAHPVGTTVSIIDFLKPLPVRYKRGKSLAIQNLAKLKDLLRAYAFARPCTRFRLRVQGIKDRRLDWDYVPPSHTPTLKDAAQSILAKSLVSHCFLQQWPPAQRPQDQLLGVRSYGVQALMLEPSANLTDVTDAGQYVSIDGRPVSVMRGIGKKIAKVYQRYLGSQRGLSSTPRKPFICMQISCPRGSYDANVEPAKDDVCFEDESDLLDVVEAMFKHVYGQQDQITTAENTNSGAKFGSSAAANAQQYTIQQVPLVTSGSALPGDFDNTESSSSTAPGLTNPWTIARTRGRMRPRNMPPISSDTLATSVQSLPMSPDLPLTPRSSYTASYPLPKATLTAAPLATGSFASRPPVSTARARGSLDTWLKPSRASQAGDKSPQSLPVMPRTTLANIPDFNLRFGRKTLGNTTQPYQVHFSDGAVPLPRLPRQEYCGLKSDSVLGEGGSPMLNSETRRPNSKPSLVPPTDTSSERTDSCYRAKRHKLSCAELSVDNETRTFRPRNSCTPTPVPASEIASDVLASKHVPFDVGAASLETDDGSNYRRLLLVVSTDTDEICNRAKLVSSFGNAESVDDINVSAFVGCSALEIRNWKQKIGSLCSELGIEDIHVDIDKALGAILHSWQPQEQETC